MYRLFFSFLVINVMSWIPFIHASRSGLIVQGTAPTGRGHSGSALYGQSLMWVGGVIQEFDGTSTDYSADSVSILDLDTQT